ncbi:hypothetical protein Tco_0982229, partial [Tanacetum coccineum]
LPDDPYVAVRQAQLVDTNTKSELEEAPSEAEEPQPLGSIVPLMSEEFEASELSDTRTISSHSSASSDSTAPLSPDHLPTHVSPTPTPTRGESSELDYEREGSEDESLDLDDERESHGLDDESHGLDDEGHGLDNYGQGLEDEGPGIEKEEEVAPEARRHALESTKEIAPSTYEVGQSSRSVLEQEGADRISAFKQPTLITWVDPEDGRVYTDIPTYAPPAVPVQTPPSLEWSSDSLPVLPSSLVVPSPIASPVATPAATISVDEDHFLEVGAQLEIYGSILHDHTQRLDALPPTLFEGYNRDLRELYTRSGAVRDKIFLQSPVLALEAWAGQTDAQRAALWHAIYDIQRENHNLRRQITKERRERLEMTDRVARIER